MAKSFHLAMRDFVTFRVTAADASKRFLHECKDSAVESGYSLLVHVEATHAGVVNGNLRFYRPDLMQESTHSWVNDKRPRKPVLTRHDDGTDPLGRVVTARYIDTKHVYTGKYPSLTNLLFYDSVSSKRLDLYKSVNWVYNTLQKSNKDYEGLGYISLGLNVTHPDAIGKVQRGEYATVSVGFTTDAAICSICHQDWSSDDGRCEHRLGEMVDGSRMFLIAGRFDYEELSFVTFPADPFAAVKSTEVLARAKDSMALRVFLLGEPLREDVGVLRQPSAGAFNMACADMLEADIHIAGALEGDATMEIDLDMLRTEIQAPELTQARALALRLELKDQASAKRLLSSLNAKIKKNSWDPVLADAASQEEVEIRLSELPTHLATLTDAGARKVYLMQLEADAKVFSLDMPLITDATLEVPAVPISVFATAPGLSLLDGFAARDSTEGKGFVASIESLVTSFRALPENDQYYARTLLYQIWDVLGDETMIEWYKKRLSAENSEDSIISRAELNELHDAVEGYELDRTKFSDSLKALKAVNRSLLTDHKYALAQAIVMYSVLAGEKGFTDLSLSQIRTAIDERCQRQLTSLRDSLKDLHHKLAHPALALAETTPTAEDAPAPAAAAVQVGEVLDSVVVDNLMDQPLTVEPPTESLRGTGSGAMPILTLDDLREMRKQNSQNIYRQLKLNPTTEQKTQ